MVQRNGGGGRRAVERVVLALAVPGAGGAAQHGPERSTQLVRTARVDERVDAAVQVAQPEGQRERRPAQTTTRTRRI